MAADGRTQTPLPSPPERIEVDGATYVRAYPVAKGNCPHCGGSFPAWTPGQIIDALQAHADDYGIAPAIDNWQTATPKRPNRNAVIRVFGKWSSAVAAAGLTVARFYWTRDRILDALRNYQAQTGQAPTVKTWGCATPEHPAARQVIERFGSWNAALDAAGFYPRGPYGVKLRPELPKTPEKIGRVHAGPVADVLRAELVGRSLEQVSSEIGVDTTYISRIVRGLSPTIRADYADRILTKLDRPDLLEAARAAA